MMKNIKDFTNNLKNLKDLQSSLSNLDMSNPNALFESMGLDMDELSKQMVDSYNKKLELKYTYKSLNKEPEYAYPTDSGFDLRANTKVTLGPLERALVPTGLFLDIPENYEIQVRPKSGLAIKKGLSVVNTPGTVDQGYTGEIQVILINLSNETHEIEIGDKIAQAVLCPVVSGNYITLKRVMDINDKDRSSNGFGSTGN